LGSLVKPFTALAYAQAHGHRFPTIECTPSSQCWLPSGHGAVGIVEALALSCNTYFRALSDQLTAADLAGVTPSFGLPPPADAVPAASYWGLGDQWRISPGAMLRAYEELAARSSDPLTAQIVAGLKAAAARGTAAGVGRALSGAEALAKTGTAPCVDGAREATGWTGDGYALVLYPANQPRYSLLVRIHGVPGREAANLAGEILRLVVGASPASRGSAGAGRRP
jgi:cell division protein FtsI/penicillin-binding protein 2